MTTDSARCLLFVVSLRHAFTFTRSYTANRQRFDLIVQRHFSASTR